MIHENESASERISQSSAPGLASEYKNFIPQGEKDPSELCSGVLQFYQEIANVPELPPDLYRRIERKIRRRLYFRNLVYALAASIVILVGTFGMITINSPRSNELQPEVASELQIIHDYLNSSDLEGDLALYAVVEGY